MLKSYPMRCFCKSLHCAKPFSTYHCGRPGRFQENKDGISSGSFHLSRVTLETNLEIKTGDYSASVAGDGSKPLGRLMKKMCSARGLLFSFQNEGGRLIFCLSMSCQYLDSFSIAFWNITSRWAKMKLFKGQEIIMMTDALKMIHFH